MNSGVRIHLCLSKRCLRNDFDRWIVAISLSWALRDKIDSAIFPSLLFPWSISFWRRSDFETVKRISSFMVTTIEMQHSISVCDKRHTFSFCERIAVGNWAEEIQNGDRQRLRSIDLQQQEKGESAKIKTKACAFYPRNENTDDSIVRATSMFVGHETFGLLESRWAQQSRKRNRRFVESSRGAGEYKMANFAKWIPHGTQ